MLRRYRGLRSGFGVTNKTVTYEAFKLSLTFREAPPVESSDLLCNTPPSVNSSMLLVISATPVKSVYKSKTKMKRFTEQRANLFVCIYLSLQLTTKYSQFNVTIQNSPRDTQLQVF